MTDDLSLRKALEDELNTHCSGRSSSEMFDDVSIEEAIAEEHKRRKASTVSRGLSCINTLHFTSLL